MSDFPEVLPGAGAAPAPQPIELRSSERVPLRIGHFPGRGRGVVADRAIQAGELVERSPVLVIPPQERAAVDATVVFTYVFMWEHGTVEEALYRHDTSTIWPSISSRCATSRPARSSPSTTR